MAVRLLFENSASITVLATSTPESIAMKIKEVVIPFHCIARGKLIGISNRCFDDGRVINPAEITGLREQASGFVWKVHQEHEDDTIEELLAYLTQLQANLMTVKSLTTSVMSELITKWKLPMVWSTNALEGCSYTMQEAYAVMVKGITACKPIAHGNMIYDGGYSIEYVRGLIAAEDSTTMLTEKQILDMHRIVLKHAISSTHVEGGVYRTCPVMVTGSEFVFPQAEDVPQLMRGFIAWLNDPERRIAMHPAVFATEAHLRFVTIHPFGDGNGRMCRLIMNIVLMKCGYAPMTIHPECRDEYLAFVKHYQMAPKDKEEEGQELQQELQQEHAIAPLLKLVANEMLAAMEDVLQDAQKQVRGQ